MVSQRRATILACLALSFLLPACQDRSSLEPIPPTPSIGERHNAALLELGFASDDKAAIAAAIAHTLQVETDDSIRGHVGTGRRLADELIAFGRGRIDVRKLDELLVREGVSAHEAMRIQDWAQRILSRQPIPAPQGSVTERTFLDVASWSQSYWGRNGLAGDESGLKFSTREWVVIGDAVGAVAGTLSGGPAAGVAVSVATSSFLGAALLSTTSSVGALHNEALRRAEKVGEQAAESMRRAGLQMLARGAFDPSIAVADVDAAIAWGETIAPKILRWIADRPGAAKWATLLREHGVGEEAAGSIAALVVRALDGELPSQFEAPPASASEALFRDVLSHSAEHWRVRGKMNREQKIVVADAVGGLLGSAWGGIGGILGGAFVSYIAAG